MANGLSKQLQYPMNFKDLKAYQELCVKLEKVVLDEKKDGDVWKDRFFLLMLYQDDLCKGCKEDMRKSFYERDRNTVMNWRPAAEQICSGCKYHKAICY